MVFPDHTGPVYSVTVLNDATFILSAGSNDFDTDASGTAQIWDWQGGFSHTAFGCPDGAFLSSAEFPAWRLTGLGCSNNFSYIWDWDTGVDMKLPFEARTPAEVEAAVQGNVDMYVSKVLQGKDRLALKEKEAADSG